MEQFSIVEIGSRQYIVEKGRYFFVNNLEAEYKEGDKIEFDKVLLTFDGKTTTVGKPYVENTKLKGVVEEQKKGKKITLIYHKNKNNFSKKRGHRQLMSKIRIEG